MIDVCDLLYEICENDNVYDKDFDLISSGILDSLAFIELFSKLEEMDINLYPTRIDRELLRTPKSIEELIKNALNKD